MEAWRRAEYLRVLGIDVWVPRHLPSVTVSPGPAPEVTAVAPVAPVAAPPVPIPPAAEPAAVAPPPAAPEPVVFVPPPAPVPVAPVPVMAPPEASAPVASEEEWESLRAQVLTCTKCPLHSSRTQGVFGVGNRQAQWLVIGEAPGQDEDRKGEPFVGRAGQLLDQMLRAIGLSRTTNVYIANVLKSRPPNNREPAPAEVSACRPYLLRQIELVRPKLMLAVGRIAAQNVLGTDMALGRLRGKVHHFGELNIPLIVTYHPAYLLRAPAEKRKAWDDLKFARSYFHQLTNGSTDGDRS